MEFCPVCGNLLYLREEDNTLIHVCRFCDHRATKSDSTAKLCVSSTDHSKRGAVANLQMFRSPATVDDPTLPRVDYIACANNKCTRPEGAGHDVVFMKYDATNMRFAYHCAHCHHVWTNQN